MKKVTLFTWLLLVISLSSCDVLLGKKNDDEVRQVLEQGAIDPNLVPNTVGYVPVLPAWKNFINPHDVFVGYDEMVYVVDDRGIHVLDQKGTLHRSISLSGATKISQDRRMLTYICAKVPYDVNGITYLLPAVYIMKNLSGGNPEFIDTLIHPFCDNSRNNTNFRGNLDEQVEFAGVTFLHDNSFYLARRGPTNSLTSSARPDNCILSFDASGRNTGYAQGLSPVGTSLKSCLSPTGITSFVAPPQIAFGMSQSTDFLVLQGDPTAEYKTLWIKKYEDPDLGIQYTENPGMLNFDTSRTTRFLYDSYRFGKPMDICFAPDETQYLFIVDAAKDSVFQFTSKGFEGVNAPATFSSNKQIIASFGGSGSGPAQFNHPEGLAYFKRVLYVADTGNGRIVRFKLSTDLER